MMRVGHEFTADEGVRKTDAKINLETQLEKMLDNVKKSQGNKKTQC
ncbi:MAG: hypothetical protein KJO08_01620 [Gammaproteobacteria bacterium]|nr:hypothetical protein [Gammaproteobacteria bacterium]